MGSRLQIYRQIYGSGVQPDQGQAAAISADGVPVGPRVLSTAIAPGKSLRRSRQAWAGGGHRVSSQNGNLLRPGTHLNSES